MSEPIRLGLLRLCDAAPVILAARERMFAAAGLAVELSVEPSWANIADKLSYGLLDGAVMLVPLALACAAGLRGRKVSLTVPMTLSANGNAVTFSTAHAGLFVEGGVAALAHARRLRLAVVHGYSSHDLLLRHWLATQGVTPDADVEIAVLPPAEMVGSLAAGAIDGFCAGAPWGEVAAHAGIGFIALRSRDIWPGHPEKCLALGQGFCSGNEDAVIALVKILMTASERCAVAAELPHLAALLSEPAYLDLPAALLQEALDPATGGPVFSAPYPDPGQAQWFAQEMIRWGKAPADILDAAGPLFRPDLFAAAGGQAPDSPLHLP